MSTEPEKMSDAELERVLGLASSVPAPLGGKTRLMAKLKSADGDTMVAAVPARSRLGWLAAVPLAASLAFGVYLGRVADSESFLPGSAFELLAGVSVEDPATGIEDAEILSEGDFS